MQWGWLRVFEVAAISGASVHGGGAWDMLQAVLVLESRAVQLGAQTPTSSRCSHGSSVY